MVRLLLIRHGIPVEGGPDAARPLSPEGLRRTRAAMQGLVALGLAPAAGVSSLYVRAAQTLDALQAVHPALRRLPPFEGLCPASSPGAAEAWLRAELEGLEPAGLALVSHQPFLGDLVRRLTGRVLAPGRASCTVLELEEGRFLFSSHLASEQLEARA